MNEVPKPPSMPKSKVDELFSDDTQYERQPPGVPIGPQPPRKRKPKVLELHKGIDPKTEVAITTDGTFLKGGPR